jgi:hypothetical protein
MVHQYRGLSAKLKKLWEKNNPVILSFAGML